MIETTLQTVSQASDVLSNVKGTKYKVVNINDEQPEISQEVLVLFELISGNGTTKNIHSCHHAEFKWTGKGFEYKPRSVYEKYEDAFEWYRNWYFKTTKKEDRLQIKLNVSQIYWYKEIR